MDKTVLSAQDLLEDSIELGIKRACKTLQNVTSAWVQDQTAIIKEGKIKEYRVRMKVTFVLKS